MKKLPFLLILILILFNSCNLIQEKGIDFKIINNSDSQISNVKISASDLDSITFDSTAAKDYREDFLSMKQNKVDGHYTLSYTRQDDTTVNENHGYYTNGGSLESWIRFEIQNDTTLVKYGNFIDY